MASATTEERISALEKEVAELRVKVGRTSTISRPGVIGRTRPDFLERFTGIHANSPLADEVFREIEEAREREREEARQLEAEDKKWAGEVAQ